MDLPPFLVEFLQALAAGVTVGGAYALMCIGLGIIFGSMRVINFAQGDFLMLGMYVAFYLTTGYGILAFLGPYAGPIIAAFLAGPVVFAVGWLVHRFIVSRVTGIGAAASEGAGAYGQIIVTLGLSLILQNGGLIDEAMHLHGHRSQFWARRRPAFARRCRAACCGRCCITMTKSIIPSVTDCELANRDRPQRR